MSHIHQSCHMSVSHVPHHQQYAVCHTPLRHGTQHESCHISISNVTCHVTHHESHVVCDMSHFKQYLVPSLLDPHHHTHMQTNTHTTHTHKHTRTHTYTYIHAQTNTHTYIHTYTVADVHHADMLPGDTRGGIAMMTKVEGGRQPKAVTVSLAVRCNTMQHNGTHGNTLQRMATHGDVLQHTTTHCNIS